MEITILMQLRQLQLINKKLSTHFAFAPHATINQHDNNSVTVSTTPTKAGARALKHTQTAFLRKIDAFTLFRIISNKHFCAVANYSTAGLTSTRPDRIAVRPSLCRTNGLSVQAILLCRKRKPLYKGRVYQNTFMLIYRFGLRFTSTNSESRAAADAVRLS